MCAQRLKIAGFLWLWCPDRHISQSIVSTFGSSHIINLAMYTSKMTKIKLRTYTDNTKYRYLWTHTLSIPLHSQTCSKGRFVQETGQEGLQGKAQSTSLVVLVFMKYQSLNVSLMDWEETWPGVEYAVTSACAPSTKHTCGFQRFQNIRQAMQLTWTQILVALSDHVVHPVSVCERLTVNKTWVQELSSTLCSYRITGSLKELLCRG